MLNVVTTTDAGTLVGPLMRDRRLRKVSFTGSTPVGRLLLSQASENVLRTSMELGGNAALLVFDDADLDAAVEGTIVAKMRNMGQSWVAANRVLVQQGLAEEFVRRLADEMRGMRVGPGTDPEVEVGPLIDERQRAKVATLVEDAVNSGADIVPSGSVSNAF